MEKGQILCQLGQAAAKMLAICVDTDPRDLHTSSASS
jgi:hypothetical protein